MHSDSISSSSSSISTAAAQAPSSPQEDKMQIFVKTIKGETIPFTVSKDATVADLTTLLKAHPSLSNSIVAPRLVHSGRHLSTPSAPLSTFNIKPESIVSMALPLRGGAPKLPKCDFKKNTPEPCKSAIQRIVGDCGFCGGHFCSKHRLLESHNCEGLEDCKKESHERNAEKLNTERTVAIKGI